MDSRAEFEAWMFDTFMETVADTWDAERNLYRDFPTHMAWKGWLASRAAMKPMTDAEGMAIWDAAAEAEANKGDEGTFGAFKLAFVRAVEAHHGIKP